MQAAPRAAATREMAMDERATRMLFLCRKFYDTPVGLGHQEEFGIKTAAEFDDFLL
jgi:hypothetical protein